MGNSALNKSIMALDKKVAMNFEDASPDYLENKIDNNTLKSDSNNKLKIADRIELNSMLNAFRIAINGSLTKQNMVDGAVDEFEDETGIDTVNSIYEVYDSTDDYYSPDILTEVELDYMEYSSDGNAQTAYVSSEAGELQCYSENTIVEQGSYSLKAIANQTNSLNDFLIRTIGAPIDLSGQDDIYFDARASRTGTNLELQLKNTSDTYTKLLLHCQGRDTDTTSIDDSESGHTVTFGGNAQIDTAQSKFLDSSVLLDGDDYLSLSASADWDIDGGTGNDFTFEAWIRLNSNSSSMVIVSHDVSGSDRAWNIALSYQGSSGQYKFQLQYSTTGSNFNDLYSDTLTMNTNTWYHVEIDRDGNTLRHFLDGVAKGTNSVTGVSFRADSGNHLAIGIWGDLASAGLDGWIDEIRLSKGIARNSSGFTPSTTPHDLYTKEIAISVANTWEAKTWDISSVDDADKDEIREIALKIINADTINTLYIDNLRAGANQTGMTLISNSIVAEAEADNARIVIFEEDVDAVTINTDLLAYLSRDGGTTFSQVTLADEGDYENGKRILTGTVDISGQPSGTNMEWKIVTTNSKELKIHGVGELWD